jgi:hypothetical protein
LDFTIIADRKIKMEETIFAVIKDGIVSNAIVGESIEIVKTLLPESEIVQVTTETGNAVIGGSFANGKFIFPQPFPSWVLDSKNQWQAPVEEPKLDSGFFAEWNEENLDWDILEIPSE